MLVVRIADNAEGGSRFEELDVAFPQPGVDVFGNTYQTSRPFSSDGVIVDLPDGIDQDWHVAPNRQMVVVLAGRVEVETTDGQVRRWGPGEICIADDCNGKGHRTSVTEAPARLLFLRLADDFSPEDWSRP